MVSEVFGPHVLIQGSSLLTSRQSWHGESMDVKMHYLSTSILQPKHLQMSFSTECTPFLSLFTDVIVPARNRLSIFPFTASQFDVRGSHIQFGSRFTDRV
jgi:hypothetical protein